MFDSEKKINNELIEKAASTEATDLATCSKGDGEDERLIELAEALRWTISVAYAL